MCVFFSIYGEGGQQTDNCHEFDYKNKLFIVLVEEKCFKKFVL